MKKVIRRLIDIYFTIKLSKKVTVLNGRVSFYRTSRVSLKEGATSQNIIISKLARIYGCLVCTKTGEIKIGEYVHIGPNTKIYCMDKVYIGSYTTISPNVMIVDNNNHPINPIDRKIMCQVPEGADEKSWKYSKHAPILIGETVWIGENSRILKGITIGENAIIGANSVVTKDVPANAIAVGNPARVVKVDIDKTTQSIFSR